MNLKDYSPENYSPGAGAFKMLLWYFLGFHLVKSSLLPVSAIKVLILRIFGSRIGKDVVIKPGVKIKHPWKLTVGDYTWLGEDAWIDNVAEVKIGSNCCISQGVYICGGDHDYKKDTFDLRLRPITIGDGVWLGAKSIVAPGTQIQDRVVLTLGSIAKGLLNSGHIYSGNPASAVKVRESDHESKKKHCRPESILFINQAFYPDNSATSQYLTDVCTYLADKGYAVTVLCSRLGYLDKNRNYAPNENYKNIKIIRTGSFQIKGKSKFVRIVNGLLMNLSLLWKMIRLERFDTVVAMTSPPLVAWTASYFIRKPRLNFIYWLMDLNPDQAITAGWMKPDSLLAGVLKYALSCVLNNSSRIIVLDNYMKEKILPRVVNPNKIEILPLWINKDLTDTEQADNNDIRRKYNVEDKFVIMYSGNLSLCHPLDTMLYAAKNLKSDPSITFLVVGGGPALDEIIDFKNRNDLDNLQYLPYQERTNLRSSLSAADLHLVSLGENFSGIVHPSKIYGILGVEKPFILLGPQGSYINDQFVSLDLGKRIAHGEVEALEKTIRNYKDNKERLHDIYKINLNKIRTNLLQDNVLAKFENIL